MQSGGVAAVMPLHVASAGRLIGALFPPVPMGNPLC